MRFCSSVLAAADSLPAMQRRQDKNTASVCACMLQVIDFSPLRVALLTEFMRAVPGQTAQFSLVQSPRQAYHCLRHCCSPVWVITLSYVHLYLHT